MWRIGLLMGGTSLVYFGMNSWIPDTLEVRGGHHLIALSLGLLNFMQLPVSAALAVAGDSLLGRRWPYVFAGLLSLLGVSGYVAGPLELAPICAGLMGAASSLVFIMNLGLPAVLAPGEVARFSGFMFTVGYGCAFFGPALGGFAWDLTGRSAFAILPMGIAALAIVALGASLPQTRSAAGGVSSRVV
jgi:CP family cyanate transporter-like MFS transporter